MKKILEAFKWFCTLVAIATVAVMSVTYSYYGSASGIVEVVAVYVLGLLTFIAAISWGTYCIDRMVKAFRPKIEEFKE